MRTHFVACLFFCLGCNISEHQIESAASTPAALSSCDALNCSTLFPSDPDDNLLCDPTGTGPQCMCIPDGDKGQAQLCELEALPPSTWDDVSTCAGGEARLTRWAVAVQLAWNYCMCGDTSNARTCAEDMANQLAVGPMADELCGYQDYYGTPEPKSLVYEDCLAVTSSCDGISPECWELTGWSL